MYIPICFVCEDMQDVCVNVSSVKMTRQRFYCKQFGFHWRSGVTGTLHTYDFKKSYRALVYHNL